MTEERKNTIKKHVEKETRKLKKKVMQLAIENNYPFIHKHLQMSIISIERAIQNGELSISGDEHDLWTYF